MSDNYKNDEYGTEEDLRSVTGAQAPASDGSNPPLPKGGETVAEKYLDWEGKKVPYSELKKWNEAHTNQSKWQTENTKKAQDLAQQRKDFETKYPEYERAYKEWKTLNDALGKYPDMQKELETAFRKYTQSVATQGPQPVGHDPALAQLRAEIEDMKAFKQQVLQEKDQQKLDKEREAAYAALTKKDPKFNKEEFDKFFEDLAAKSNNMTDLYDFVHSAYTAKTASQIAKDAEKKTLGNIKNREKAAVETGKGNAAVALPENKGVSGKNWNDVFDEIAEKAGIPDWVDQS